MVRNLHIIIMLVAGIIVSILGLINGYDLRTLSTTMIIVLIIFFLLGAIIQSMLNKIYIQVEKREKARLLSEMDEEITRIKALDDEIEDEYDADETREDGEVD